MPILGFIKSVYMKKIPKADKVSVVINIFIFKINGL